MFDFSSSSKRISRNYLLSFFNVTGFVLAILIGFPSTSSAQVSDATTRLIERNKMFDKQIIRVADNVYTAIGYTVSANSMIVGDEGVIIVDPGQIPAASQLVRQEFEKITDKPVRAIIYTHGHGDHTNGAIAFYEEDQGIQIWQRDNYDSENRRQAQAGLAGGARPSNTQGFDLPDEQKIGVGVAIPPARPPSGNLNTAGTNSQPARRPSGTVPPTHTFGEDRISLEIAGVKLDLVAAPGETDDQLYVWLPEQRVIFAGDNFYQSWPNLYPLRGTARRSARDWITSLASMRDENPLALVGGHTTPITEETMTVITNYHDALKWVHDKTIEGAKKFMTPDELVDYAALPEHLANLDYLQEYYGSIWGTVRDIYAQDLGWFDGNVLNLHRENPVQQAQRIADLVGGVDNLMQRAQVEMDSGDELGAAQLARHVTKLQPNNADAFQLLGNALAIIAERTFNAPARNYTFSSSNRYLKNAADLRK
ncbi:MAG TPA: alkyl sulfatase [Gammaproteobacteria bacterium]|nr:alkyl sulfatase [Gammaproteobacteria bacterium]